MKYLDNWLAHILGYDLIVEEFKKLHAKDAEVMKKIGDLQDENIALQRQVMECYERMSLLSTAEPVKAPPRQARNWRQVVQFAEQGESADAPR